MRSLNILNIRSTAAGLRRLGSPAGPRRERPERGSRIALHRASAKPRPCGEPQEHFPGERSSIVERSRNARRHGHPGLVGRRRSAFRAGFVVRGRRAVRARRLPLHRKWQIEPGEHTIQARLAHQETASRVVRVVVQ